jgi:hypothetical protein
MSLKTERQAARGKMTEQEFDQRMNETEESYQHWQSELDRLKELRDNRAQVYAGLDYVDELLAKIQDVLPEIDIPPKELRRFPKEKRIEILSPASHCPGTG